MITISLGQGAEFFINDDKQMGIRKLKRGYVEQEIMLGHASETNLDTLLIHISSLRIHTERK